MISKFLRSNLVEWLRAIFILAQIVVFTAIGGMLLKEANHRFRTNETNEVSSVQQGTVAEKTHTNGYTYYQTSYVNKVPITMPYRFPALYTMTITIEENNEKIEKTVDVSKEEYDSYEIGDTYTFK